MSKAQEIAREAVRQWASPENPGMTVAEYAVNLALEAAAQVCLSHGCPALGSIACHQSDAAAIRAMMEEK